ncbi:MAG: Verru_Chthon cassette protein D [Candidatus Methylacidiphilales bacterium]|nr:Verru_Chthon cassette protein D [Candidatus Methylacidiphilales bacterium]
MTMCLSFRSTGSRKAFNLVELMLVMSVMSVLLLMSLPAITNTLRSSYLNASGLSLLNNLGLARQTAISRNLPVEVRLYKLPEPGAAFTANADTWWAYQLFLVEGSGNTPLTPVEFMQKSVVISPAKEKSALLGDLSNASSTHREMTPGDSDLRVGPYNKNYRYVAFRLDPNGAANLTSDNNFITLLLKNDKTLEQGGNYFTVQIDPINGTARSFRP